MQEALVSNVYIITGFRGADATQAFERSAGVEKYEYLPSGRALKVTVRDERTRKLLEKKVSRFGCTMTPSTTGHTAGAVVRFAI